MRVTITIQCDNAAFEGEPLGVETARILERLAKELYSVSDGYRLRDYNGNTVGTVKVTDGGWRDTPGRGRG